MKSVKYIGFGVGLAMLSVLLLILIFSIILANSNFNENYIEIIILIISGTSLIIGSMVPAKKIKKNGSIIGGITAIIYMITLYVISSVTIGNFYITQSSIIMFFSGIILGIIGGIIGVNIN